MECIIIINAFQDDFDNQMRETLACYSSKLADFSLSFAAFLPHNKKDKFIKYLSEMTCGVKIEEIQIFISKENYHENQIDTLAANLINLNTSFYLFPSNLWGKEVCTRFAFRKKAFSIQNAIDIKTYNSNGLLVCKVSKFSYSNNCIAEFALENPPFCIALAKEIFEYKPNKNIYNFDELDFKVVYYELDEKKNNREIINYKIKEKSNLLSEAKFIVVCGQGIDSKEKIMQIKELAESINAEFGVTRPVAMQGHEGIERIVGISGAICKADICISIGTSGAGAYFAGIEKCKLIVAVNTNKNAQIMERSDVVVHEEGLIFMQKFVQMMKSNNLIIKN